MGARDAQGAPRGDASSPAGVQVLLFGTGCGKALSGTAAPLTALSVCPQASSSAQISHPCYPRGYQENVTVAELYDSPCVRAPGSARPGLVLRVTGTGDPAACGTAVQRLFNLSCAGPGPCGFNGVYQPPVRGQFFVSSSVPTPGGTGGWGQNPWGTALGSV